jgi:hypothetical protein
VGLGSPLRQPHPLRIILQRPATNKAAQYHGLPRQLINTHLDKEAAAVVFTVVEIDAALVIPALR